MTRRFSSRTADGRAFLQQLFATAISTFFATDLRCTSPRSRT
jgi:hypothetical protein